MNAGANTSENLSKRMEPDEAVETSGGPRDIIGRTTSVTRIGGELQAQISIGPVGQDGTRTDSWSDAANESWRFMAIESELEKGLYCKGIGSIRLYLFAANVGE